MQNEITLVTKNEPKRSQLGFLNCIHLQQTNNLPLSRIFSRILIGNLNCKYYKNNGDITLNIIYFCRYEQPRANLLLNFQCLCRAKISFYINRKKDARFEKLQTKKKP